MEKYIPVLKRTKLFAGIGEEEIFAMLKCLETDMKNYNKGEYVFREGEYINKISVVIKGKLYIQKDDYWGNLSIVNVLNEGELFGEAYAFLDSGALLNDVVAVEDSIVIFFNVQRILTVCSSACRFHTMIIHNLFLDISSKNRMLTQKLNYMAKRTTREKLISYLSEESKKNGSSSFAIPFNRQQLADFLYVDRSAMSNELCKMRDEGLLKFRKNQFTLL